MNRNKFFLTVNVSEILFIAGISLGISFFWPILPVIATTAALATVLSIALTLANYFFIFKSKPHVTPNHYDYYKTDKPNQKTQTIRKQALKQSPEQIQAEALGLIKTSEDPLTTIEALNDDMADPIDYTYFENPQLLDNGKSYNQTYVTSATGFDATLKDSPYYTKMPNKLLALLIKHLDSGDSLESSGELAKKINSFEAIKAIFNALYLHTNNNYPTQYPLVKVDPKKPGPNIKFVSAAEWHQYSEFATNSEHQAQQNEKADKLEIAQANTPKGEIKPSIEDMTTSAYPWLRNPNNKTLDNSGYVPDFTSAKILEHLFSLKKHFEQNMQQSSIASGFDNHTDYPTTVSQQS